MNLLLPRSDRRRFFLLSDFQSNALHGDINKTLKTLLSPFFLTSTAAKPLNNAAVPLRTFLSGNEYSSKRRRRPPSDSSPKTQTPQIVAAGLLLSLSSNKNPSKRCRRPPLIPLRQRVPLKTLPQASSDPSPETKIHSKRCRRVSFIPLQRKNPSKRRRMARREQRSVSATFILILF